MKKAGLRVCPTIAQPAAGTILRLPHQSRPQASVWPRRKSQASNSPTASGQGCRTMTNAAHAIETKYIRQIQQQQVELTLLKAERDDALRERDLARARSEATSTLIEALVGSVRPYGFSRKRFLAAIRKAARTVPDHGPAALQHGILFEGSNRILAASRIPGRAATRG
ncbi:hypothetical protein [Methylobacterium sp. UNC378MF]|uniref:hypothetical protein n=1 Tax=Methylobacterium sp. UNC378MF TaxID=1502748 RepID=UPI001FCDEA71|nr:hypothetical protein [Methylobacterium sp. UNC378MF]